MTSFICHSAYIRSVTLLILSFREQKAFAIVILRIINCEVVHTFRVLSPQEWKRNRKVGPGCANSCAMTSRIVKRPRATKRNNKCTDVEFGKRKLNIAKFSAIANKRHNLEFNYEASDKLV